MNGRTIYEHQLPREDDPDVVRLSSEWIGAARVAQRPGRAMAYAIPSAGLGVIMWGELNRWTGFQMHWYVMAGTAIAIGVAMGFPCRMLGVLFDRRWAIVLGALALVVAVIGDLYATTLLAAAQSGRPWLDGVDAATVFGWLVARQPIDWLVAGLCAAGAVFAGRPPLDARQLLMQARIDVAARRLDEAEAKPADAA